MLVPSISKVIISLCIGTWLTATSLAAVSEGALLKPQSKGRTLVATSPLRLSATKLRPEVEIVIFFYSASWCAPCKQVAKALRSAYPKIVAAEPRIEVVTYCTDFSADARADYLRETNSPWPAIAPELIGRKGWPAAIAGGTPQFQAFTVTHQEWHAFTEPSDATSTFKQALARLNKRETKHKHQSTF